MDPLKQLKLELPGVKNVLLKQSHDGNLVNFLNGIEKSLEDCDGEAIQYYLEQINIWYDAHIDGITSNDFVLNKAEHVRNMELLKDLCASLKEFDFEKVCKENSGKGDSGPRIFLSHASENSKYADVLEKLITGLGVSNEQLIYTSHPLHGIPVNEDIFDYLRNSMQGKVFVIILWSDAYINSPACLAEMGAAWIKKSDFCNVYVPTFDFIDPKYSLCPVNIRQMGIILNGSESCKQQLIELKDKLLDFFDLDIDERSCTYLLDQVNSQVKSLASEDGEKKS